MARRVIEGRGKEFLVSQGLRAMPEVWEDGLRTEGMRGLFEWWYFYAILENGTTVTIIFFTRPILQRNDPLTPFISVAIKMPGLPTRQWMVSFPAENFSAATNYCDVHIGDNWVRGNLHAYTLHVALDELAVDLELAGTVEPWRPGAGMDFYDEALNSFFAWLVPVPLGEVRGQLRLDGQEFTFQGSGYHDHNWGNVDLSRVLSHWHWGRFHLPPYMGIFVEMKATQSYNQQRIPILMVARDGRIIFETGTGHIQLETTNLRTHTSGHQYPTNLTWLAKEGERRVRITMRDAELSGNYSLLETLPIWKQIVARFLGKNPHYLRFRSWMTLELQLPEAQDTLSGPVHYEIMYLT